MTEPPAVTLTPDLDDYPSPAVAECPYEVLDRMRQQTPVYRLPTDEYVVTGHSALTFVTGHPELFSSQPPNVPWAPGWSQTMIALDPPAHTPVRKVVYRSFTPARINALEPRVREIADGLIDGFVDHGEVEFVTAYADPLPLFVMMDLLGLPRADASWLERLLGPFEGQAVRYRSEETQRIQEENGATAQAYLREHVLHRIRTPRDDVISEFIANHLSATGAEPDVDYLTVELNVLLAGGIITTGHHIGNAMMLLLEHPAELERVRADHSLIPRMLEEALRVESAAQWMPRYATRDTELEGVKIPRGARVLIVWSAANRDPARFDRPERFDPRRPNVEKHVGLGHGAHFCLGAPLARLESRVAFEQIFTRLHNVRLAPGKNDFRHVSTAFFRAPNTLQLWFERADRDPFGFISGGRALRP